MMDRRCAALERALQNIRELNQTAVDENGHRWARSDLIEQEIVFALGASDALAPVEAAPVMEPVACEPWAWWLRDLTACRDGFFIRKRERLALVNPPEEWEVTPLYAHLPRAAQTTSPEDVEALREALDAASKALVQAAQDMKGRCPGVGINAALIAAMQARRTIAKQGGAE